MRTLWLRSPRHARSLPRMRPSACGGKIDFVKRHLLNVLAGVSLVLFLAMLTMWVRSYFVVDSLHVRTEQFGSSTYVYRSSLCVGIAHWRETPKSVPFYQRVAVDDFGSNYWPHYWSIAPGGGVHFLGFWYFNFTGRSSVILNEHMIVVPFWFLLLAFALFPSVRLFRARRQARADRYLQCSKCGYDLRATPDRCPECGTVPLRQDAELAKSAKGKLL
jgi:hypothetical protein